MSEERPKAMFGFNMIDVPDAHKIDPLDVHRSKVRRIAPGLAKNVIVFTDNTGYRCGYGYMISYVKLDRHSS